MRSGSISPVNTPPVHLPLRQLYPTRTQIAILLYHFVLDQNSAMRQGESLREGYSFRPPEQIAEVNLAQIEVRQGKVATDLEVQELWDSFLQA